MPLNFGVVFVKQQLKIETCAEWLEQHVAHSKGHECLLLNGSIHASQRSLFAEMQGRSGWERPLPTLSGWLLRLA